MYDAGSRVPLAVRWPAGKVKGGRVADEFASLADLAPTFLEAAGLKPRPAMTGRSLLGLLRGDKTVGREQVFLERKRHAHVRAGNLGYPCRAVRTKDFLYVLIADKKGATFAGQNAPPSSQHSFATNSLHYVARGFVAKECSPWCSTLARAKAQK